MLHNYKIKVDNSNNLKDNAMLNCSMELSLLIREIHKILMTGVRGEHKTPGEFRTSQNWIGGSMPSIHIMIR